MKNSRLSFRCRGRARTAHPLALAWMAAACLVCIIALPRQAAGIPKLPPLTQSITDPFTQGNFTQIDGRQPLVEILPGYPNLWLSARVNLWSGNLIVQQYLPVGRHVDVPQPVFDPAVDFPFGSSPSVRALAGPTAQIQAQSRISIQALRELPFVLTYNVTGSTDTTLGLGGWRHTYQVSLGWETNTIAAVTWGDGRRDRYARGIQGSDTSWVGAPGLEARTIRRVGAGYVLSAVHGGSYQFDLAGRLVWISDRQGGYAIIVWGGDHITNVISAVGHSLDFTYNGSGQLVSVNNALRSKATLFEYDGRGCLSKVTDPANRAVRYEYDADRRLVRINEQDGDGISIAYYPGIPVVREVTMGNARRTFSFDEATKTTVVYDLLTDGSGNVAYTFDAGGRCLGVNDNGVTFASLYDPTTGWRTQYVDAHGNAVTAHHDSLGNLTSVIDPYANVDSVAVDPTFHLASQTRGPLGATWTITRDEFGNPTQVTDVLGNTSRFVWGPSAGGARELGMVIGARNDTTRYSYGGGFSCDLDAVQDPVSVWHQYAHDNLGRLVDVWDPRNPENLLLRFTYTGADEVATVAKSGGYTTAYDYFPTGQMRSVQEPSGATTIYAYDALNRLIRTTDPLGNHTDYTRDCTERVTMSTDALGQITRYTHDPQGHVRTVTDADGSTWTYNWGCCELTVTTDPAGQTVNYSYDDRGFLTSKSAAGVSNTYDYDDAGQLATAYSADNDTAVVHTYAYDPMGRLVGHSQSGVGLETHYDLDAGGLPIRLWDTGHPDSTRYTYDKRGLPTNVSASVGGVPFTAAMTWDELAAPAGVMYNTGVSSAFTYDARGWLESIGHIGSDWSASYAFDYDADGALLQVNAVHPDLGAVTLDLTLDADKRITEERYSPGRDFTYSYDIASRRTHKTAPYSSDTYTWSLDDRLLSAGASSLMWDAAGRCTSMVHPPDTLHITYRTDGALETITRNGPTSGGALAGTWRATIDAFGQLVGWKLPDGQRFWIGYDNTDVGRLRRSTSHVYAGTQYRNSYVFAPGGGEGGMTEGMPIMKVFWGGTTSAAQRRLAILGGPFGSANEVAGGTGRLAFRRFYGAFGEAADTSATVGGLVWPLQVYDGIDIVPKATGSGGLMPGVSDSTLLISQSGGVYLPRLGFGLRKAGGETACQRHDPRMRIRMQELNDVMECQSTATLRCSVSCYAGAGQTLECISMADSKADLEFLCGCSCTCVVRGFWSRLFWWATH